LQEITAGQKRTGAVLDVGCGPASRLQLIDIHPVGVDLNPSYCRAYAQLGGISVQGSANALPFADRSFAAVWSIGMFHHLPPEVAHEAVREMVRVCAPGGQVAILDGVLPRRPLLRLPALLIRRADRGRFMRSQEELTALLPDSSQWQVSRFTYTLNGLEMLAMIYERPASACSTAA
jgi:SAM-dependent methyltransferase